MAVLADDQMIVHQNFERLADRDDLMRQMNIAGRRLRVAGRVIMQLPSLAGQPIDMKRKLFISRSRWGVGLGAVARDPT